MTNIADGCVWSADNNKTTRCIGLAATSCLNYIWMLTAVGICDPSPQVERATKNTTLAVAGTVVLYECETGYRFADATNATIVCDGADWTSIEPACQGQLLSFVCKSAFWVPAAWLQGEACSSNPACRFSNLCTGSGYRNTLNTKLFPPHTTSSGLLLHITFAVLLPSILRDPLDLLPRSLSYIHQLSQISRSQASPIRIQRLTCGTVFSFPPRSSNLTLVAPYRGFVPKPLLGLRLASGRRCPYPSLTKILHPPVLEFLGRESQLCQKLSWGETSK